VLGPDLVLVLKGNSYRLVTGDLLEYQVDSDLPEKYYSNGTSTPGGTNRSFCPGSGIPGKQAWRPITGTRVILKIVPRFSDSQYPAVNVFVLAGS
jgi:hypothetical protein